jgi:hypothetical protein
MTDEKREFEPMERVSGTAIIPAPAQIAPTMIRPIVKIDEALAAWNEYQELRTKLASEGDFVEIQKKQHPTKQFANKISRFFGLSVQIVKADKEMTDDGFTMHIWARATAPNGQYRDGDGHCSSGERNFTHLEHDVYATAVTRAKNRAILELVGFGEVSKEEIIDDDRKNGDQPKNGGKKITLTLWDGRKVEMDRFTALRQFQEAKKAVGEKDYYETLGSFGFEKSDQIPLNRLSQVFDVLVTLYKQKAEAKKQAK